MSDEREHLAQTLRSAAGWLNEAARRLDEGDIDTAATMLRLGQLGSDSGMAERIEALRTAT